MTEKRTGVMGAVKGLKNFPVAEGLPCTTGEIQKVLQAPQIRRVICYALGPEGTNISQACRKWVAETGIVSKTTIELGKTPEKCLEMAQLITGKDEIALFWTCAVFYALKDLFFENPDVSPFFVSYAMLLDEMQLATRKDLQQEVIEGQIPEGWKIASHPSPAPLVGYLADNRGCVVVKANSNAEAASMCVSGEVEACITTEKSRQIYGVETLHVFGSPVMIFFGGITGQGAEVIRKVYRTLTS